MVSIYNNAELEYHVIKLSSPKKTKPKITLKTDSKTDLSPKKANTTVLLKSESNQEPKSNNLHDETLNDSLNESSISGKKSSQSENSLGRKNTYDFRKVHHVSTPIFK